MTCGACTIAQANPHAGRFDSGCRACQVRYVALMPQLHRHLYIDKLAPDNREARMSEDWGRRADVRAWLASWRSRIAGVALRLHVWKRKP